MRTVVEPERPSPVHAAADGAGSERFSGILVDVFRWPATGATVILALVASVATWTVVPSHHLWMVEPLLMSEPWRVITSVFVHLDIVHLSLNLYWTWILGKEVERRIGTQRTLALLFALAVGSSSAEYVLLSGGVGLSGVVYGLFGYLWSRRGADPSIRELLTNTIIAFFVGCFLLCIAVTVAGWYPVANIAHAVGWGLGAMIGKGWTRKAAALSITLLIAALLGRPFLNFGGTRGEEHAQSAISLAETGRSRDALEWTRKAIELDPESAYVWHTHGFVLYELQRFDEGLAAYERAVELAPELARDIDIEGMRAEVEEWHRSR